MARNQELEQLRCRLETFVERFELEDLSRGLVGQVKVSGGVLLHPLTRASIEILRIYGAGNNAVKVLEPKFLRSLPAIPIDGVQHATQFCASVANALSLLLNDLKTIHAKLSSMGINLDLEHDVLMLHGQVNIGEHRLTLIARQSGILTLTEVGNHALAGKIPCKERSLALQGNPEIDLKNLTDLVIHISEKTQHWSPSNGLDSESDTTTTDIVELTEVVEQMPDSPDHVPPDYATDAALETSSSLGSLKIRALLDKLGSGTEISAHENKLQLVVPVKVIQGIYVFTLEQSTNSQFQGVLTTPNGTRHQVLFDMEEISDIKDVLDQVMLKNDL